MAEKTEFHGGSRRLTVDGLVSIYDSCSKEAEPCLVSLEAPSGWGKTRIVREFYARLAVPQSEPKYWPDEIAEADEGREVERSVSRRRRRSDPMLLELHARRKAVRPAPLFERPGGSVLEFFWWGIACSERNGAPTSSLRENLRQVSDHRDGLDEALRRLSSRRQRMVSKAKQAVGAAADEGFQEVLSKGVELTFEAFVPVVGVAVRLARMGIEGGKEHKQRKSQIAEASVPGASADIDIVDDCVALLGEICRAGLPIVIVVEDLHHADDMLLELLYRVLSLEGPVLVIATTLPDMIGTDSELVGLLEHHSDRVHRVGHEAEAGEPFEAGAGLMALDGESRLAIARGYCPQVAADTLEAVADRYENPLALEVACQLLMLRNSAEELPSVRPTQVTTMPLKIRGLYEEMWKLVPEETRVALAVAHTITPAGIASAPDREQPRTAGGSRNGESSSRRAEYDRRWTLPVLHDVIKRLHLRNRDRDDVLEDLVNAPNAYSWVRIIDDYLRSFAEGAQSEIVQDKRFALLGEELLLEEERADNARRQILEALAAALIDKRDQHPDTLNRSRTILALYAEGFITDPSPVAAAIAFVLDDVGFDETLVGDRQRLYQLYLTLIESDLDVVDEDTDYWIRLNGIDAIREGGSSNLAAQSSLDLSYRIAGSYGTSHPLTLLAVFNLARSLKDMGRVDDSIGLFRRVVEGWARALGEKHPDTLNARHDLAGALNMSGRVDEALVMLERVLAASIDIHGQHLPATLRTRHSIAVALLRAGRYQEAVAKLEELVEDRTRALGEDHPKTLNSRDEYAVALARMGRVDEALDRIRRVVEDRTRVLGADNPNTLTAQHNLAWILSEAGRVDEALDRFERVVEERSRVLGADNPNTLTTRNNIAFVLHKLGRVNAALEEYREIVEARTRVLGADSPDTLLARNNFAGALSDCGQVIEAAEEFQRLIPDLVRVLGDDHMYTLQAHGNLASELFRLGRSDVASPILQQVLADSTRVLGGDHPFTVKTQINLDTVRRAACELEGQQAELTKLREQAEEFVGLGRHEEAIQKYRRLLADSSRVLGDDHPSTLNAAIGFANSLRDVGRYDDAVAAQESVLDELTRKFGDDDPNTWRVRNNLAFVLGEAGRVDEAIDMFKRTIDDSRRVLGEDHHNVLKIRNNLAGALYDARRYDEAVEVHKTMLDDLVRLFGDGHPNTLRGRNNLASVLGGAGRVDEAIDMFKRTLADSSHMLGEDHPHTLRTRTNLAAALRDAARLDEAADHQVGDVGP